MDRKKKVVIGIVTAGLISAGGAAALWSANGSGSGTAQSITAATINVTAATGAADLYPGVTDGDVYFTVTNPNPYAVTLTTMTPGAVTTTKPGCAASNVTVAPATSLSIVVPAGASNLSQSIPNVVTMAPGAPDACQGASFTIPMTLTGMQS